MPPSVAPTTGTRGSRDHAPGTSPSATRAPIVIAAITFIAHLAVVAFGPYGPHRDALLYYAMGEHLRLFAMDFPPFIAIVARVFATFGNIELITHIPIAAAHCALILLAAAFARRSGGGGGVQSAAALCVATAAVFMRAGSLFQPVVFDQLWWTAALWLLALVPGAADARRRWLALGAVLGLGLLTKFTILVLGAAILVAIILTPERRSLRTPWPWLAGVLALAVGSPSIIGQMMLGWPFLTQFQDLASVQLVHVAPLGFVVEQFLIVGPVLLLAIPAALMSLRPHSGHTEDGDTHRAGLRLVVLAALVAFVLMLFARGKPYYIAPIWPALIGIGFGRIDRWRRHATSEPSARRSTQTTSRETTPRVGSSGSRRTLRTASLVMLWTLVIAWGVIGLPMGLPFLGPEPMSAYAARLGAGTTTNTGEVISLPQDYADMLGWEDQAAAVEAAWHSLTPDEQARTVILATNYGRAGAIDWFGSDALPAAIAPVGSYWFWGPGPLPGEITIVLGDEAAELEGAYFRSATEFTRVRRPWGVTEEQDVPVTIARDPLGSLQEFWPRFEGMN